jgi:hypothetical protein
MIYDVRQCEKLSPGKIKARSDFMLSIPQAIISLSPFCRILGAIDSIGEGLKFQSLILSTGKG